MRMDRVAATLATLLAALLAALWAPLASAQTNHADALIYGAESDINIIGDLENAPSGDATPES